MIRLHLRPLRCDISDAPWRGLCTNSLSWSHFGLLPLRGPIRPGRAPGLPPANTTRVWPLPGTRYMLPHCPDSSRRTTLLLSLLLFISTAALFYIRAHWSKPVLPHLFPATANLDKSVDSSGIGPAKSCNCTSPTMPDPGVFPGGKAQSKVGWNVMPAVQGADLDTTTFRVGSGALVSDQRPISM